MKKRKKRNRRMQSKADAKRRLSHAAAPTTSPARPVVGPSSDNDNRESSPQPWWTIRDVLVVGGAALALVAFVKDARESLSWVDRIVHGYRDFYASIWRSLASPFPDWMKPFDAPQTYDALTIFALLGASLIGSRKISLRGRKLDLLALSLVLLVFQFKSIRIMDPSPYDVVANTAADHTVILTCLGLSGLVAFHPKSNPNKRAGRQAVLLSVAVSTFIIWLIADDSRLLSGAIAGTLPPDLTPILSDLRHVAATATLLVALGLSLMALYAFRGPRRPLVAYSSGIAAVLWGVSIASPIIERALNEANF